MSPRPWFALALLLVVCPVGLSQTNPIKPVNLDKLNTEADEEDPLLAPDGTLLFARKVGDRYAIHQSRRATSGSPWGAGKPVITEKDADHRSPFVHKSFVYFATRAVVDEKLAELKNYDIVRRVGQTSPVPIQGISEKSDELGPWITPGGKEFYFSRKTEDGWVLFVAEGPIPGPIGKAKPVGFPTGYHRAALTPSALQMYLQGPLKDGRVGLYRSNRAKVGAAWSAPEPLSALNDTDAKQGDMMPSLTPDGTRLYFVSDRDSGKGGLDLWTVATAVLK